LVLVVGLAEQMTALTRLNSSQYSPHPVSDVLSDSKHTRFYLVVVCRPLCHDCWWNDGREPRSGC
jgi:hypothetical protein